MATCHSCGIELTGLYCNNCGARAQEEVTSTVTTKPRRPRRPARLTARSAPTATTLGLLGIALFCAGMIAGFWLAQGRTLPAVNSAGTTNAATAVAQNLSEASDLPAIVLAGEYMDQGVERMQKDERTAAVESFRKAITQYERVLTEDPNNLYARSFLGLTHFYAGSFEKAVAVEREVLQRDPDYLWAIFNLAWMYETTGRPVEASMMYQQYIDAAQTERENRLKYLEQYELIDRQLEAAGKALAKLRGGDGP